MLYLQQKIHIRRYIMNFTFNHNNLNVLDLEKSLEFYKKALGLEVVRKREAEDEKLRETRKNTGKM